jgi:hypothetical protein
MKAVASALPALIGTILGVCIYVKYLPLWLGVVLMIVGGTASILGRSLVSFRPVVAAYLIALWILVGVGAMAYATTGLLWLGLNLETFFPKFNAITLKEVGATISGAFATFLGVVITKDFEDGGGPFWPGTFFKKCIQTAYKKPLLTPDRDTREAEAVWEDRVRGGPQGWGYKARLRRAEILREHLKRIEQQTRPPSVDRR